MSLTPRIAIDAMGGDVGVRVMCAGAAMARHQHERLRFLLVGDETRIKAALENHPNLRAASEIIHTDKVVSGEAKPSQALRSGRGSSMGLAIDAVKRSEEHTSELQSLMRISYAVFCLKQKKLPYSINRRN